MALWTSLAVLSLAVSTTLSFPDSAYNIPNVGTGRRSQYYVLHDDGTYKYGHDTGEGAFESAKSRRVGEQVGEFGYRSPEGQNVRLSYEANEAGFRPVGSHIPEPHPEFLRAHEEASRRPPFFDPLAEADSDASYSFGFSDSAGGRQEESDREGNVRGSYFYTDDDGVTRSYSYTAGRGGFMVEGDDLPQAPVDANVVRGIGATPAATALTGGRRHHTGARRHQTGAAGHQTGAAGHRTGVRGHGAGSGASSFGASRTTGGVRSGVSSQTDTGFINLNPDGSYSFAYDAGTHDRSETGDADLNVEGQFSFIADDGVRRQVVYEAGSDTGFIATGDHLPKPVESEHSHTGSRRGSHGSRITHGAHSGSRTGSHGSHDFHTGSRTSHTGSRTPHTGSRTTHTGSHGSQTFHTGSRTPSRGRYEEANTQSVLNPDGSYAFEYQTSTHSRAEAGDSQNNVDGEFDFIADDGVRRGIEYEAGSDTGFIAEGAHIPVGPPVPGAPSGQPTGRIVPVQSTPDPLADSNADASYSFNFDTEQYSRTETADADGNVRGEYTVVDDDGTRRTYEFRSGKGIGFETQEVGVSRGPRPTGAGVHSGVGAGAGVSSGVAVGARPSSTSSSSSTSTFSQSGAGIRTGVTGPVRTGSSTFGHVSAGGYQGENFNLRQYDQSENRGKYGYVLTFDR